MTTPLIEAIARALHDGDHPDDIMEWPEHSDSWRANYARSAQAALTAITEAGYAVVPVEPTEAMLKAAADQVTYDIDSEQAVKFITPYAADTAYRTMILAAQRREPTP